MSENTKVIATMVMAVTIILSLLIIFGLRVEEKEHEVEAIKEMEAAMCYAPPETTPIGTNSFVINLSPDNDPSDLNNEIEKLKSEGYEIKIVVPYSHWIVHQRLCLQKALIIASRRDN